MQFRLELSGGDPFTGARVTSGLPNRFLLLVMISFRDSSHSVMSGGVTGYCMWNRISFAIYTMQLMPLLFSLVKGKTSGHAFFVLTTLAFLVFDSEADSPLSISFVQSFRLEPPLPTTI